NYNNIFNVLIPQLTVGSSTIEGSPRVIYGAPVTAQSDLVYHADVLSHSHRSR
ncbi:unnamed protein product, partial [Tenebrio molitor]